LAVSRSWSLSDLVLSVCVPSAGRRGRLSPAPAVLVLVRPQRRIELIGSVDVIRAISTACGHVDRPSRLPLAASADCSTGAVPPGRWSRWLRGSGTVTKRSAGSAAPCRFGRVRRRRGWSRSSPRPFRASANRTGLHRTCLAMRTMTRPQDVSPNDVNLWSMVRQYAADDARSAFDGDLGRDGASGPQCQGET
jgi:hypothetical protein